jgi:hypothetical protein
MIDKLRLAIRNNLEVPVAEHMFGIGWLIGLAAIPSSLVALLLLLSAQSPQLFSMKEMHTL